MGAEALVFLTLELRDGIALLGLNRPERANAYHQPLLLELRAVLARLADAAEAAGP